jgi:hypothetical protein
MPQQRLVSSRPPPSCAAFQCGEVYKGAKQQAKGSVDKSPPCASDGQERSQQCPALTLVPGVSMLQWAATVSHSGSGACAQAHTMEHVVNLLSSTCVLAVAAITSPIWLAAATCAGAAVV